jgi:hypothetical protein
MAVAAIIASLRSQTFIVPYSNSVKIAANPAAEVILFSNNPFKSALASANSSIFAELIFPFSVINLLNESLKSSKLPDVAK